MTPQELADFGNCMRELAASKASTKLIEAGAEPEEKSSAAESTDPPPYCHTPTVKKFDRLHKPPGTHRVCRAEGWSSKSRQSAADQFGEGRSFSQPMKSVEGGLPPLKLAASWRIVRGGLGYADKLALRLAPGRKICQV